MLSFNCQKSLWFFLSALFVHSNLNAKFHCASQSSSLSFLGTNSSLYLLSSLTGFDGTLVLKDNVASTISATTTLDSMSFSNGVLVTGVVSSVINGMIDPAGTDSISLQNGDFLDVQSGVIVQSVSLAAGATATILGQPRFSSQITLGDASSVLQMSITTDLNQTVSGDGALSLLDDLSTGQNVLLPGKVFNNGKSIILYGGTYSTATAFTTGGKIELKTYTSLTDTWTIGTGTDVYHLNGNGTVLDFSANGHIVFNGTTLYISDMNIRGISDLNPLQGSGRIVMSNVVLELADNFARTDGSFTFYGDPCKIITNGSSFQISGSGNEILVDGVVLRYDQLDGSGVNPISAVSSAAINFANGGAIQSASAASDSNLLIYSSSYTFMKNFDLSAVSNIQVINATPGTPKPVTIDGGGHAIRFPHQAGGFLVLNDNVQLTLTNIVLKDFLPSAVGYGTSSTLTFGDSVVIELGDNVTVGSSDPVWTFAGNATIDCKGCVFEVTASNKVTQTGAKTLTIEDAKIKTAVSDGIVLLSDTSFLRLYNSTLLMNNLGFACATGSIIIDGFVKLTGNAGTSYAVVPFEFSSKGIMSVLGHSELYIDNNIKLKYNADPTDDTTIFDSKRHFSLAQIGSKLTLNGCTLESTDTGLALDQGTVRVLDRVSIIATTATGAEFEIGPDVEMTLASGAYLAVDGPMKYSE